MAAREHVTYNAAGQSLHLNHFNGNKSHAAQNPMQRLPAEPCLRKVDFFIYFYGQADKLRLLLDTLSRST